MRVLLIGNGPAALAKEVGELIDNFKGHVVRFNNYKTRGFEKFVGTRTDYWITCERNAGPLVHEHKARLFISWRMDEATEETIKYVQATRLPKHYMMKAVENLNYHHPSSGAIAATYFLEQGHDVWIWGFDFLMERRPHHYSGDKQPRGKYHSSSHEWLFFNRMMQERKIKHFAFDPTKEGIPAIRRPVPCGKDDDPAWYREAAHAGWYKFIRADGCVGSTVLDVGAGLCEGMKILEQSASRVAGFEVDERLSGLHSELVIGDDLSCIKDKSFDVVTCVDVIEHVVEDIVLMNHMKRIAKKLIYVTTPNHTRSKCGNIAHCREYSIAQFMNVFRPTELWSGSPDGGIHHTKLLTRYGDYIIDHSAEGPDNKFKPESLTAYTNGVPLHARFNNTVDGEEWPHICAIFELEGR